MINDVGEYVTQHSSMVLATNVDGEARASTACFALGDHMTLYFFVFRDSVKHRGIMQHPQVSVVIDDGFMVPMRGVEIIGAAEVVEGAERRHGQTLLTARFPNLAGVWDDPRILIVRVVPTRVRYTDWTQGAGHSHEANFPAR